MFNKIDVSMFQDYMTKYPNGISIFESLSETLTSFNIYVDEINAKFGTLPEQMKALFDSSVLTVEQLNILEEYYSAQALLLESVYAPRLTSVESQLADKEKQINSVKRPLKGTKKAYVVFVDDDGRTEFLTNIKPIFDARNAKCNIAVQTAKAGTGEPYLSWEQLHTLEDAGYGISSHGHNHYKIGAISDEAAHAELGVSKMLLQDNGFSARTFVYGDGCDYNDSRARELVKQYYECGVATSNLVNNTIPLDSFCLTRYDLSTRTLANAKALVDNAVLGGYVQMFMTHAWMTAFADPTKQSDIGLLIDYIVGLGVEIVTLEQLLDKVGNVIEIGDPNTDNRFAVSKTGDLVQNLPTNTFLVNRGTDDSVLNALITTFPYPSITNAVIGSTAPGTFPSTAGNAVVSVYRISNDYRFSYRTLRYYNGTKVYYQFLNSDFTWGAWIDPTISAGGVALILANGTNFEKPLTDYPMGITYESWTTALAATSPTGTKGTTIVYKLFATLDYNYEEFIPYNVNAKYMRRWLTATSVWGTWAKIGSV